MTLYLHIGSHKTGTTSVQDFFIENRDAFLSSGLAYLNYGPMGINANRFANSVMENDLAEQEKALDYMASLRGDAPDCLISAENLFSVDPLQVAPLILKHIAKPAEPIVIICYLRRQDSFLESLYLQRLRHGRVKIRLPGFIKLRLQDGWAHYAALLDRWQEAFPRAEIRARVYERSRLKNGDAVADFLSLIGHEDKIALQKDTRELNSRTNRDLYDLLLALAQKTDFDVLKINSILSEKNLPDTGGGRNLMSLEEREALLSDLEEDTADLGKRYLGSEDPVFTAPTKSDNKRGFNDAQIALIAEIFSAINGVHPARQD